jgi:hypothetical protein
MQAAFFATVDLEIDRGAADGNKRYKAMQEPDQILLWTCVTPAL